ncbi:MAG: hypothetical protein QM689_12535 [Oscillospiraceae bacterium]
MCQQIESLSIFATVFTTIGSIATVFGVLATVCTYRSSTIRQSKLATIEEYTRIRDKYPNLSPKASVTVDDATRLDYIKEMERFCTGINLKIYDIKTLNKMSGARLTTQYEYLKDLIEVSKGKVRNAEPEKLYCEYSQTIKRIRALRSKKSHK